MLVLDLINPRNVLVIPIHPHPVVLGLRYVTCFSLKYLATGHYRRATSKPRELGSSHCFFTRQ